MGYEEVKREMQAAIAIAYTNPLNDSATKENQSCIPRKGEIPTPDEFIRHAAIQLKSK